MTITSKIELQMIAAIRETMADANFEGCWWKSASTSVWQAHTGTAGTYSSHRWIEVIHNAEVVALIEPNVRRLSVYNAASRRASQRINAILREFAPEWEVEQRKDALVMIDKYYNPQPFTEGFSVTIDPWHPQRESQYRAA